MKCSNGFPLRIVANDRVVETEDGTAHDATWVKPGCHREDDGKCAATTAAQGPVEVGVLIRCCDEM